MTDLTFKNPEFFWLLILLPALIYWRARFAARQMPSIRFSSLRVFQNLRRTSSVSLGRLAFTLRLIALGTLIIALARPQLDKGETIIHSSGVDIVLAIDVSSSMLALDFATPTKLITRLDVAKDVTRDFIERRKHDRIGLIAFAADPYIVSPITLSHDWLIANLERLKTAMVPDGTAIGSAIAMGANRMRDIPAKSKILILLTDGENNAGQISPLLAAEAAAAFEVRVYTISIGIGGNVPSLVPDGQGGFVKDFTGSPAIVNALFPVDTESLEQISDLTGGRHYQAKNREELEKIYDEIESLETTDITLNAYSDFEDSYWPWLLAGFLLLLAAQLLQWTRGRSIP